MTTHRLLQKFVVSVPQSQLAEYRAAGVPNVLSHPDRIKGLTPKLNFLLDQFAREDAVVFLDDDLVGVTRCFQGPDEGELLIRQPALVHEIIEHTLQLAADVGAYLFGWEASNGAVRYYTGLKPLARTGYVNGCAIGFRRGHGLRFDERIVAKNDFDVCALNAYLHRTCLKNCRYTFVQKATFTGRGGQAHHRTSDTEKADLALLRQKFGAVFRTGGYSGTRKRDYAGAVKVTMHLPY